MHFDNHIELVVRSGETGEVKETFVQHNAISDDFLIGTNKLYLNDALTNTPSYGLPYCFLLPDDASWTGFVWDRTNPWAPMSCTAQRTGDQNNGVDAYYKSRTLYNPNVAGNPTNKYKLFYQWTALPHDITLKAIGLTAMQEPYYGTGIFGVSDNPMVFVPQTLVILPSTILVRGREAVGGVPTQTPDILEVSYFLSIVGVS